MESNVLASVAEVRARAARHGEPELHREELIADLAEVSEAHFRAADNIHRAAGDRPLTASEQRRFDAHLREREAFEDAIGEEDRIIRERKKARARNLPFYYKAGGSRAAVYPSEGSSRGPWADLSRGDSPSGYISRAHDALECTRELTDAGREMLADAMTGPGSDLAAQVILARSHPDYLAGFAKLLREPERAHLLFSREEQAAFANVVAARSLATTTGSTGGFAIPLSLDPNLVLSNSGAANPFRRVATVQQAISSPHRTVKSAGVTAQWTAEGVAFGDNSPTLAAVDVDLHKLTAFVSGTYEILQDAGRSLMQVLPEMFADARDRAEVSAYAVGSGSGAPKGIVTSLAAASSFVT